MTDIAQQAWNAIGFNVIQDVLAKGGVLDVESIGIKVAAAAASNVFSIEGPAGAAGFCRRR